MKDNQLIDKLLEETRRNMELEMLLKQQQGTAVGKIHTEGSGFYKTLVKNAKHFIDKPFGMLFSLSTCAYFTGISLTSIFSIAGNEIGAYMSAGATFGYMLYDRILYYKILGRTHKNSETPPDNSPDDTPNGGNDSKKQNKVKPGEFVYKRKIDKFKSDSDNKNDNIKDYLVKLHLLYEDDDSLIIMDLQNSLVEEKMYQPDNNLRLRKLLNSNPSLFLDKKHDLEETLLDDIDLLFYEEISLSREKYDTDSSQKIISKEKQSFIQLPIHLSN